MTSPSVSVLCSHCGRPITDEGYSAPAWWHIHSQSFFCNTTKAEPPPNDHYVTPEEDRG